MMYWKESSHAPAHWQPWKWGNTVLQTSTCIKIMGKSCERQCFVDRHVLDGVQEYFEVDAQG